ncbi:PadR family transcriptional regulator [Flavilitoribacter nigricans]|uniref:PadR family transcriptional regulator n=1 Tax=Flavilitoribacter nigricans (strain ATCC 23147 / DSM 23189 / NBRC 102662 / NCIMB 1420 / SS-2) TaxID=1122177 RepID=A0A2D0NCP7_FLAN2|nr:helix-turn-helix transcriptional regulator [Flavilitoribacter nigricans]PHN06281.1 PadR family transcriptional regulator [Flavilitoribacter nigricans DSM 23189 = NBRC 102662]
MKYLMTYSLGQLEESVLLIVMILKEDAYGVSVAEAYEQETGNSISIPAIHTVLKRLEQKGMLRSEMGSATAERGGRRKRIFEATPHGYRVIADLRKTRLRLWSLIPKLGLYNG